MAVAAVSAHAKAVSTAAAYKQEDQDDPQAAVVIVPHLVVTSLFRSVAVYVGRGGFGT